MHETCNSYSVSVFLRLMYSHEILFVYPYISPQIIRHIITPVCIASTCYSILLYQTFVQWLFPYNVNMCSISIISTIILLISIKAKARTHAWYGLFTKLSLGNSTIIVRFNCSILIMQTPFSMSPFTIITVTSSCARYARFATCRHRRI